jgi:hypothetical protein
MRLCLMLSLASIAISESEVTWPVGLWGLVPADDASDRRQRWKGVAHWHGLGMAQTEACVNR